jgi:hypothetical protein
MFANIFIFFLKFSVRAGIFYTSGLYVIYQAVAETASNFVIFNIRASLKNHFNVFLLDITLKKKKKETRNMTTPKGK